MKPEEKLREDIAYWEEAEREAVNTLMYTGTILAGLREALSLSSNGGQAAPPPAPPPPQTKPKPQKHSRAILAVFDGEGESLEGLLTGSCGEQIMQAYTVFPQGEAYTSNQLEEYVAEHGERFSRGAIDYNLRALHLAGKLERVKPRKGLNAVWAYRLPQEPEIPEDEQPAILG